jgi:hypothetical protein
MEAMRQSWTDDRLDNLSELTDRRFGEVDRRFDQVDRRFHEVDRRFDEVDRRLVEMDREAQRRFDDQRSDVQELRSRLDTTSEAAQRKLETIQRLIAYVAVSLTAAVLAGFGGMATLLASQT